METLEEWLKSNAGSLPSIVQKWADKLIELGKQKNLHVFLYEVIDMTSFITCLFAIINL